jgi:hypothetical protein
MNEQQRAVVQQALDAFDSPCLADDREQARVLRQACDALRQLLEQPEPSEVVVKSNGHVSPLLTHMMNKRTKAEAKNGGA